MKNPKAGHPPGPPVLSIPGLAPWPQLSHAAQGLMRLPNTSTPLLCHSERSEESLCCSRAERRDSSGHKTALRMTIRGLGFDLE